MGHNHFFLAVVVICFIITLLWSFFYFLQMRESVRSYLPCTWLSLEYYYTIVATVSYLIAFIVILSAFGHCAGDSWCDPRIAGGVREKLLKLPITITITIIIIERNVVVSHTRIFLMFFYYFRCSPSSTQLPTASAPTSSTTTTRPPRRSCSSGGGGACTY